MKFGKEFASQMVPEWEQAYMNYKQLKGQLKQVKLSMQRANKTEALHPIAVKRNLTLYRAFSGLTKLGSTSASDGESQVIIVQDAPQGYETTFLRMTEEEGQHEVDFFKKLDHEFNKVLKFYEQTVREVMNEASVLNKQMEALIAFRVKVENPNGWMNSVEEIHKLSVEVKASRAAFYATAPFAARAASRKITMDVIDEESSSDFNEDCNNGSEVKPEDSNIQENKQIDTRRRKLASVEILEHVKLNDNKQTPSEMIRGIFNPSSHNDLRFTKRNLRKAETQLKQAFVEFYHKLMLLKSYSFLNIMAFSKIMKKYDKVTSRNASKTYMKVVDDSYLGTTEEVSILIERVEATFIKHFASSNHSKGMHILRPKKKKESHTVSFSMGFLLGCALALILALVVIIHARNILNQPGKAVYMETMFPLYSVFAFIVLHMLMFAANIYFWRRYRVNYAFIFGLKEGTELGYREILLVSFSLLILALACVLANLDMEMDPVTQDYKALTELLPLGLLVLVISIMLCPFNIAYRPTRRLLLVCLYHCVLAPLYKVSLPDFFLADQLTSQVQALRSLEFYVCYYGWGDFTRRQNSCNGNKIFITCGFIIAGLPYWIRFLQCLRRLIEEKDAWQGYNSLKYLLTIVAVFSRTAFSLQRGEILKYVVWTTSIAATVFSAYWDLVKDWGLFQRKSKNRWLRDKLLVPHKSVYFVAMFVSVILRFAWMQTVMNIQIFSLHKQTTTALVSSLEIIRRGLWNFFRLENEHLNNVGNYRAFKSVPLPFNYDDDDGDKDE